MSLNLRASIGILGAAMAGLMTVGCYVESLDDRPPGAPGREVESGAAREQQTTDGACRFALGKGCFDGHVVSKKEFFVDGNQFFNADDLGAHFARLITITDGDNRALAAGKDFEVRLQTPLDVQSFAQGFEYYLTGDSARSGKLRSTGDFSVNDLPQGTYDLRVQKPVRFQIVRDVVTTVPATDPAAQPVTKTERVTADYCATLYTDTVVEVRRGERTWGTFGDFRLHVTDEECSAGGNQTTISLRDR